MIFRLAYFFVLLTLPCTCRCQSGFEKVYLFEDTTTVFSNIRCTDSCYYFLASTGNNTNRLSMNFGKLDLEGNVIESHLYQEPNTYQYSGYQFEDNNKLNFRGNFVFSHAILNTSASMIKVIELTPEGTVVFDSTYSEIWSQDSLNCAAFNNLELLSDSTYLVAYNYGDYATNSGIGLFDGMIGVVVLKIKYDGSIIWKKKFQHPSVGTNQPPQYNLFIDSNDDNSFLLGIRQSRVTGHFDGDDVALNYFIKCDAQGNELDRDTFHDTFYCYGNSAFEKLQDGTSLFGYEDSHLIITPEPNYDDAVVRPVIARLDVNHQLIWKVPLTNEYYYGAGEEVSINDIVVKQNKIYSAIFYHDQLSPISYHGYNVLHEIDLDGNIIWKRNYGYFPIDSIQDPSYIFNDIDTTSDGGFILAGNCYKWDDFQGTKPYQYGYILKTNCLGFIGPPEASVGVVNDSNDELGDSITFVNESIQAGSFSWFFGDGSSLESSENVDSILHVYSQPGTYHVLLVAHGCNGENDSLAFNVEVNSYSSPVTIGETLLTVFPNPIESDNHSVSIYVGNVTQDLDFQVSDANGKIVYNQKVNMANTTYLVPITNLSSGEYQFSLVNERAILETEKVIKL